MNKNVKPCPFCGKKPTDFGNGRCYPNCHCLDIRAENDGYDVEKWNKRIGENNKCGNCKLWGSEASLDSEYRPCWSKEVNKYGSIFPPSTFGCLFFERNK